MKVYPLAIFWLSPIIASGFSRQQPPPTEHGKVAACSSCAFQSTNTRRAFFQSASFLVTTATVTTTSRAPAYAGLLDEFGSDPSKITQAPSSRSSTTPVTVQSKSESLIEPNLRSNYYYPTNKKRYLPRIKKCSDQLSSVATALGQEDWNSVQDFTRISDDTILPLKLYTSSLTGGGTNVKVSYTNDMYKAADVFEANHKRLLQAVKAQNLNQGTAAIEAMSEALQLYRQVARLTDDEMGDLPSVDEIRRASSRKQLGVVKDKPLTVVTEGGAVVAVEKR